MKLIKFFSMAMFALCISMVSCSPEDGKDGIDGIDGKDGINGVDGQDGADGINGQDGADGVGFDELVKFGYITLELEGIRADNVAFQDSTSFRFTNVDPNSLPFTSSVYSSMIGNFIDYEFTLARFLSAPDDGYQDTYMTFYFNVLDPGKETQDIVDFSFGIRKYAVVGDDNKYFTIDESYDIGSPDLTSYEFTDVAYVQESNNLTFSYAFTIDAASNPTGNELSISGNVDVIVLEKVLEP